MFHHVFDISDWISRQTHLCSLLLVEIRWILLLKSLFFSFYHYLVRCNKKGDYLLPNLYVENWRILIGRHCNVFLIKLRFKWVLFWHKYWSTRRVNCCQMKREKVYHFSIFRSFIIFSSLCSYDNKAYECCWFFFVHLSECLIGTVWKKQLIIRKENKKVTITNLFSWVR